MAENSDKLDAELIHLFLRQWNGSEHDREDDDKYQEAPEAVGWEAGKVSVKSANADRHGIKSMVSRENQDSAWI